VTDGPSFYEAVGGRDTFVRLVDRFYDGVAADPVLRGMYPADLDPARKRMTAFLAQYWGGPRDYSELRGHPRLRMRHAAFRMDTDTRDRWLRHMRRAVEDLQLDPDHETQLWADLERAAVSLAPA
jgi:hemoglobin